MKGAFEIPWNDQQVEAVRRDLRERSTLRRIGLFRRGDLPREIKIPTADGFKPAVLAEGESIEPNERLVRTRHGSVVASVMRAGHEPTGEEPRFGRLVLTRGPYLHAHQVVYR